MAKVRDCKACGGECCRHVALQIDTPTCKTDYDNIRWYLMHEGVAVFRDHQGGWNVEFDARCTRLTDEFRCARYSERPKVCRGYPGDDELCEYESDDSPYDLYFETAEEFEAYLDREKIEWRWKRAAN